MANEVVQVRVDAKALALLESIADECNLQNTESGGNFLKAFRMASGMRMLRQAITADMMKEVMELQGSSLGFRTDRDSSGKGYDVNEVKECLIEAVLRGASPVGNEFNIIANRAYLTKEFFTRKLREYAGLTDLRLSPGVPVMANGGALVPFTATWRLNGRPDRMDRLLSKLEDGTQLDERICVRVNSGMGADAIIGKATRKMMAAIYGRLTGSEMSDGDASDEGPAVSQRPVGRTLEQITERISGNGAAQIEHTTTEQPDTAPSQADQDAARAELNAVLVLIGEATEKLALNRHKDRAYEICQTPADEAEVASAVEQANERIDASRGTRTNQKTMVE